eukprot:TRINITY_DN6706_c0_g1_i1.p1 TRINITY_DN6706_c0_g1~~TRINITY_DN6706_c0_g1_i1.p1  ORF type:complete len:490 (-),score=111.51 TRINITY_DN6706_c0_g1_i1:109-1578(-)
MASSSDAPAEEFLGTETSVMASSSDAPAEEFLGTETSVMASSSDAPAEESQHEEQELVGLEAAARAALSGHAVEKAAEDLDERLLWKKNAPFLYDFFLECVLPWPALTVAWLPDVQEECTRLAVGTHTDGSEPCQVTVVELAATLDEDLQQCNPWRSWQIEGLGRATGFGMQGESSQSAPLRVVATATHEGSDVNRLAPCPFRPQLLATKGSSGVTLFDYKEGGPLINLEPSGEAVDGFGLDWSPLQKHFLASGGNDGRLSLWDIEVSSKASASAPLCTIQAHKGGLNDLSFSPHEQLLATVSDDCLFSIWDLRTAKLPEAPKSSLEIAGVDVLTVDWSRRDCNLLATAGKDNLVRIWDMRSLSRPVRSLHGHEGEIVAVKWCPTLAEGPDGRVTDGLLASCSADGKMILWDSQQEQKVDPESDDVPAELLFAHAGHMSSVSDFAWSLEEHMIMSSVAEDNALQIWLPSLDVCAESDEEIPEAKRPRLQ